MKILTTSISNLTGTILGFDGKCFIRRKEYADDELLIMTMPSHFMVVKYVFRVVKSLFTNIII